MKGTIHMKKFKLIALFSCMLLILLSACNSNEKSSIKLAEVTRSLFYAPQYVALVKGFFEDECFDDEMQTTLFGLYKMIIHIFYKVYMKSELDSMLVYDSQNYDA